MRRSQWVNRIVFGLLTIGLLFWGAARGTLAQAASGVGPFLPEQSWDRKLACPTIANCPRFLVLTNWSSEAVLDKETGLVWQKTLSATNLLWDDARFVCLNKNIGGRLGWRLPAAPELASLVDLSAQSPLLLPAGHPFTGDLTPLNAFYWSATTDVTFPLSAWVVDFGSNSLSKVTKPSKADGARVWCVRGGMNADAY